MVNVKQIFVLHLMWDGKELNRIGLLDTHFNFIRVCVERV